LSDFGEAQCSNPANNVVEHVWVMWRPVIGEPYVSFGHAWSYIYVHQEEIWHYRSKDCLCIVCVLEVDHWPPCSNMVKMSGAIPPPTCVPSLRAQGNFTFTLFSKEAGTFTVAVWVSCVCVQWHWQSRLQLHVSARRFTQVTSVSCQTSSLRMYHHVSRCWTSWGRQSLPWSRNTAVTWGYWHVRPNMAASKHLHFVNPCSAH